MADSGREATCCVARFAGRQMEARIEPEAGGWIKGKNSVVSIGVTEKYRAKEAELLCGDAEKVGWGEQSRAKVNGGAMVGSKLPHAQKFAEEVGVRVMCPQQGEPPSGLVSSPPCVKERKSRKKLRLSRTIANLSLRD
eukprot:5051743-Amphidinium_carterae.1